MKKIFIIFLVSLLSFGVSHFGFTQPPPPPGENGNGTAGGGDVTGQNGGGAPIGSGLFILLGLGAAYGSRKLYNLKKEEQE